MKRTLFTLFAFVMFVVCCTGTASAANSRIRKEARFLTDRMGYELNLNTRQYNDVYEINYDFILNVRHLMGDIVYGSEWAVERYYDCLYLRNDDLRWILNPVQYRRFMQTEYFSRPIYVHDSRWYFRVQLVYTNHNFHYFPRPYHYRTYRGEHYRSHPHDRSHYRNRYEHDPYVGTAHVHNSREYARHRSSDFGSVHNGRSSAGRDGRSNSSRIGDKPVHRNQPSVPPVYGHGDSSKGKGGDNRSVRERSSGRVSGGTMREADVVSRRSVTREASDAGQRILPEEREGRSVNRVTTRRSDGDSSSRGSTRPSR